MFELKESLLQISFKLKCNKKIIYSIGIMLTEEEFRLINFEEEEL